MELAILRWFTKARPKLRVLAGNLGRNLEKKGGNQETQSTAARRKSKKKEGGTCGSGGDGEGVGRRKIESGARVSKLQILRKSRARDTQRHLAPSWMHLTAQTMRHRRARGTPILRAARRWVTQAWVYITIKSPKKGGGKRIKKAICREIIKTKTRATYTRANARAEEKGRHEERKKVEREREEANGTECDRREERGSETEVERAWERRMEDRGWKGRRWRGQGMASRISYAISLPARVLVTGMKRVRGRKSATRW